MRKTTRFGFTLVEVLVAVAVITVLLMIITQMLVLVVEQTQVNQQRLAAIEFAASAMEIVTAQPYADIEPSALEGGTLRDLLEPIGAEWQLDLQVEETLAPTVGKQIRLSITRDDASPRLGTVILTAWRFAEVQP